MAPKEKVNSLLAPKGMVQIRVERQDQRKSQKPDGLCREGKHWTIVKIMLDPFLKSRGWHIDKGLDILTDLKSCISDGKASACNAGDLGLIPGLGRSPGEGKGYPLQLFWPGEFYGLYSPWGSPGKNARVGCHSLLQRIFPTQGSNPGHPHCRRILYHLSCQGSPRRLEWVAYPLSSRAF